MRGAPSTRRRVAVLGAGVAGLAATKSLLEEGLEPTTFERSNSLGGLWHYDESSAGGGGPAYRSLHTNISRQAMGYSDHPIPDEFLEFPSRDQVLEYLAGYAERFQLSSRLRLEQEVLAVRRRGAGWEVVVRQGEGSSSHGFDAVAVCTGRHQTPSWPKLDGRENFLGPLVHSMDYTEPSRFADQSVLVLGVGSSGIDIAEEIAPLARRTLLSTSRGFWPIPRTMGGRPSDHNITRLGNLLPLRLREKVFRRLVMQEYLRRGFDLTKCLSPLPPFDLKRARLTPERDLVRLVSEGRIEIVPQARSLEPQAVVLDDGRREAVDAIIAATGYRIQLPFLEPDLVAHEGRIPRLYKHVFPPGLDGLAFVGMPWVVGGYPPVLELQARWVARVFAGHSGLPKEATMESQIARAARQARREGTRFDRVQPLDYMDSLAREIGCLPRPWRHPRLLISLLTGPALPVHYRIDGAGRSPEAGAMIARGPRPSR